ncbi:hypothetical protein SAMD00019534_037790 [Acytostelium subglobosum LB1]|uniref:hypothetical protein n=1 Tax=Acytostelium subglobosum LB1 TaxID=1410327 RepID=UPI0006451F62|nr:hypothetical protein SAMD00019534_037790 [Acytostelium subglobosum LB1]GAM20604.1 hypothetical protein SAMD00019534_037790 [Acytostelium subglobosum LB1]|eukprot:XP_012760125.1 hypothetical protein SAMD00019534_037790 [Acytostelium subglobosum LB1]
MSNTTSKSETYLFVHGCWNGKWCWDLASNLLQRRGHKVHSITLPGCAEYNAQATRDTNLSVHVQSVIDYITTNDLKDITLLGHSYGGVVISGVADQCASRIKTLVFIDSWVCVEGQSCTDLIPPEFKQQFIDKANAYSPAGCLLPFPGIFFFGLTDKVIVSYAEAMCTPHPLFTLLEPVHYKNGGYNAVAKKFYIECTTTWDAYPLLEVAKKNARDNNFEFLSIECTHCPHLEKPVEFVNLLGDIANKVNGTA